LHATGEVRAVGATVGGQLNLKDATLSNNGGNALNLEGAEIKGDAFLGRLHATGEVRADGATVGGQLNLMDATLSNEGAQALVLDRAELKNGAFLERLKATGEVRALGATIGGQLDLEDATLTNEGKIALSLDGAKIEGSVRLGGLTATGEVRAIGAAISGQLDMEKARLSNEGRDALTLQAAQLGSVLLSPASVNGWLSLASAQIDVLVGPKDMGMLTANGLDASGWRLGDVRGAIRHNRRAAAEWLTSNSSGKNSEFVAQPWHELASVYDRNGQPADARWLRWKAARGVTRTSPASAKVVRWIYGALTGHGYYPLVAALWLILAVLVTVGIVATHRPDFAPTATNKATYKTDIPTDQSAQPITGATPCDQLKDPATCLKTRAVVV
jgi:hypothetical protein